MHEPDIVRTGIGGLDDILTGGIPRGNVILTEGAIGTGKTTMGWSLYTGARASSGSLASLSCSKFRRTNSLGMRCDLGGISGRSKVKIG
ncbi:MAG TPA: ATPase domain-containing protein [Candidatus Acidoferrales bacterium]